MIINIFEHWNKNENVNRDQWGYIHFVGHSVGAHTAAFASELLKSKDNFEIDRVTGLDPAEPCFETMGVAPLRLSQNSGKFVDVIHTNVARSKNSGLGLLEPLGT